MRLVRQRFDRTEISDFRQTLAAEIRDRLRTLTLARGARVAIGVGSRGVSPIGSVVRTVIAELRSVGAEPFVVPAMGSHGGGTAAGQAEVLARYGISESELGVPVTATMETVVLGRTASGAAVHLDAAAAAADGVVVIGRVKPHTGFRGRIESGLCKMLVIGLGNRRGAESMHAHPLAEVIPEAARLAISEARILFGVALVENAFDHPYVLEVSPPESFHDTDSRLLDVARDVLPRIPLDRLDVLVVDRMGKDISGSGMDPNVVGMWRRLTELPRQPAYRWLAVLGLTPASGGNAMGIGLADLTSRKLVDAIDPESTLANALTSMALMAAKLPLTLPTDADCWSTALDLAARGGDGEPLIARIANTMQLETFWLSDAACADLPPTCEIVEPASAFGFDAAGAIIETDAFAVRE
jgi:hypothetical protein